MSDPFLREKAVLNSLLCLVRSKPGDNQDAKTPRDKNDHC